MSTLAALAAAALAATFAWAALTKVARPARWRTSARSYRLGGAELAALVAVPLLEVAVPAAFLVAGPLATGLVALPLLASFSLATARAGRSGRTRLPCACFGGNALRDYRLLVARNAALAVLAALALAGGAGEPGLRAIEAPAGGEVPAAMLLTAGIGLVLWTAREAAALLKR